MRLIGKILSWLLVLAVLCIAGLGISVLQDSEPLVAKARTLNPAERAWAKAWLAAVRPRGLQDGERMTLTLSEAEANVVGTYLIDRLGQGRLAVLLERDHARLAASVGLPWNPRASFLNLELAVAGGEGLPRIERARLGGLPLPNGLVQSLADRLIRALAEAGVLQGVTLERGRALLTYQWHPNALEQVGSGMVSAEERSRVIRYQEILTRFVKDQPRGKRKPIPLPELISQTLIAAGSPNSAGDAGAATPRDPAAENRAAVLALAAYVNGRTVRNPGAPDSHAAPAPFRPVHLEGRRDLAQHFMTSAALVAQGGDALSNLLGLLKEVQDSGGGSGFSFADLAADRAGTRFGQLATRDRRSALALQTLARQGLAEGDIMPSVEGLPEGIGKEEFTADYGNPRSPAYRAVTERIEQRIDRLSLHRTLGG
jgi:hypothetical protein